MKMAVTGGSGFIGSYVAKELAKNSEDRIFIFDTEAPRFELPPNVKFVEGSVLYKSQLDKLFRGCEEVYDCAGVLGTHELIFQSDRAVDINIKGAVNVFQACLDQKVKRVFHPTKPLFSHEWENAYTITKIAAENFARMYREIFGMEITILRWMNASGPGQSIYPVRKFLPLAICSALLGRDIEIYGDGKQTMDIVDVRDVACIAIQAVRSGLGREDQIWEVGAGIPRSVCEVAQWILQKTKSSSSVTHLPMRPGEALNSNTYAKNTPELLKRIGYRLQFDLEKTISDAIDYYAAMDPAEIKKALNYFGGSKESKAPK